MNGGNRRMDPKKRGALEAEDLDNSEADGYGTWEIGNHQQSQSLLVPRKEPRQQTARQPILGKRGRNDFLKNCEGDEAIDEILPPIKRHHRTVVTPSLTLNFRIRLKSPSKQAGHKEQSVIRQRLPCQYENQGQLLAIDENVTSHRGHCSDLSTSISASGISNQSLDALVTNIEGILHGNVSQPTTREPKQTLVNMAGESCGLDCTAVMSHQTESSDPRSINGEQTASFAVHRDQAPDGITFQSHQKPNTCHAKRSSSTASKPEQHLTKCVVARKSDTSWHEKT